MGDVHDIVDRPDPDSAQMLLEPFGRGSRRYAENDAGSVPRAIVPGFNGDRRIFLHASGALPQFDFRQARLLAQERSNLTRDSEMAHRVGPVGSNSDFENGIIQAEVARKCSPGGGIALKHHDAVAVIAKVQFVRGADHPERVLPANFDMRENERFPAGILLVVTYSRADQSQGHFLAGGDVGSSAND